MDFDLEHVDCNFCGNSDTKLYAKVSYMDYLRRRPELETEDDPIVRNKELAEHKFNLVKCKQCGLIYVNPRLPDNKLSDLYQQEYYSSYSDDASEESKRREKTFKVEITELEKVTKKLGLGKKILDVGCGGGFFLDSLDDSWEKHGSEINPVAAKSGKDKFGINIFQGKLKDANFPDETFDVVKMRGIIEHLPDPLSELYQVHRILRKGGLLTINTPNIGSICGKIYGEKFRMVCPTHHIYYFSTKTLSLMLKKAGFKVCKISYHYFDTPYASWKDVFKIFSDIAGLRILRKPYVVSPAFYGNVVDIYVTK